LAALHHEPNPLQLGNVGERIARDGSEIYKFPRLNCTHPCWSRIFAGLRRSSLTPPKGARRFVFASLDVAARFD
jgi:hypothetical protein